MHAFYDIKNNNSVFNFASLYVKSKCSDQTKTLPETSLHSHKEILELTVTTEKETKQSEPSSVRNRPHSVKFSVSSRARMNLECKEDSLSGMGVGIAQAV
jgi:hypothetical protein